MADAEIELGDSAAAEAEAREALSILTIAKKTKAALMPLSKVFSRTPAKVRSRSLLALEAAAGQQSYTQLNSSALYRPQPVHVDFRKPPQSESAPAKILHFRSRTNPA